MRQAWELILESGAGIGLVLILRWYWWRVNAWSEIAAMVAPVVGVIWLSLFTSVAFPESLLYLVAWTTVCWLAVTWLTPPESEQTLVSFYTRVRPGGPGWVRVAAAAGAPPPEPIRGQLLDWGAGVALVYGTLFGVGALVFPGGLGAVARFEQRLTQACILAFGIVVLFISFTAYQLDQSRPAQAPVAEVDPLPGIDEPLSGRLLEVINQGRLYVSRVISDSYDGQRTRGGMLYNKDQLTAAIPHLADGSILRVTNPRNGISVLVKVVDRGSVEREVYLSSSAADSLGLDDTAIVFVEVLSEPPPVVIGP